MGPRVLDQGVAALSRKARSRIDKLLRGRMGLGRHVAVTAVALALEGTPDPNVLSVSADGGALQPPPIAVLRSRMTSSASRLIRNAAIGIAYAPPTTLP